jgi:MFS transporter, FSR family, fosmidomycin resistance protein
MMLAGALLVGGAGSATQHPLASALIARAYDERGARTAQGTYNFAGDLGKTALPAATAWLLAVISWRHALGLVGILGLLTASGILLLLPGHVDSAEPPVAQTTERPATTTSGTGGRWAGLPLLHAIGALDSGTRMGFLAFLPFVLRENETSMSIVGLEGVMHLGSERQPLPA